MADAKNTVLFPYETLKKLSMDAFQKFGFSEKEADIIQDVLLTSDLFGIQSHGMQRMVRYHKGISDGLIKITRTYAYLVMSFRVQNYSISQISVLY